MVAAEVPVWVPTVAAPAPAAPKPTVEDADWVDLEVEGEGDHVLVKVVGPLLRVRLFWLWIGNLGDGEVRVGLRWSGKGNVWWNAVIPYLGNVVFNPPKPRVGSPGESLVLRVVGANVRLSVSMLVLLEAV